MPTIKKLFEQNIWPIVIAIVTIIVMFTTVGFNAEEALNKTAENKARIVDGEAKHYENEKDIAGMQTDIAVIQTDVARTREDVQDIKQEQRSISDKIDTLLLRSK